MFQDSLLAPRPAWTPALLGALGRHQFLTALQLAALLAEPVALVDQVLASLVAERLVIRLQPAQGLLLAPPAPAYTLSRQGGALYASAGDLPPPPIPDPHRSLYLLAHELTRNTFAVQLELLHRRKRIALHRWETARTRIADVSHILDQGRVLRVPLVADGLAVLGTGAVTTAVLVEIDMATVGVPRMNQKYRGYFEWWRHGGPTRRFGTHSLRVLTLVPDERRLAKLRAAAIDACGGRGGGLFWFGTHAVLDLAEPERLLGPIWRVAGRDQDGRQLLPSAVDERCSARSLA